MWKVPIQFGRRQKRAAASGGATYSHPRRNPASGHHRYTPLSAAWRRDAAVLSAMFDEDGRLPSFAQQRLDVLTGKSRVGSLDTSEEAELASMLEYVDEKSIELLSLLASTNHKSKSRSQADPPPIWTKYMEGRLQRLLKR